MATWTRMRRFPTGEWIRWMAAGLHTSMATSTWRVSGFAKSLPSRHAQDSCTDEHRSYGGLVSFGKASQASFVSYFAFSIVFFVCLYCVMSLYILVKYSCMYVYLWVNVCVYFYVRCWSCVSFLPLTSYWDLTWNLSCFQVAWWSRGAAAGACSRTRPSCGFGPSRTPSNLAGSTRKEEGCPPCLGATGRCAGSFCGSRSSRTLRMTAKRSWKEPLTSAQPSKILFSVSGVKKPLCSCF